MFRFNAFVNLLIYMGWFSLALFSVELIFGQATAVAGWTKDQIYILSGVFLVFLSLYRAVYHNSLTKFTQMVRTGKFDFWLLKPVSSRFLASVHRIDWVQMVRFIASIVILSILLHRYNVKPELFRWLAFLIVFASGYIALYSISFMMSTTVFWFINLFNLNDLWDEMVDLGNKPDAIYQGRLEPIFYFAVPVVLIAALPTQALLGILDPRWIAASPAIAFILYVASDKFWRFAISRYTSASS